MEKLTQSAASDWKDEVRVRLIREEDLPALEWDGEFTHFRRLYADAYRRVVRGLSLMWVADLPNNEIIGQVFIQFNCDRPELCNGIDRAYLYSFRVRPDYRSKGVGSKIMDVVERDLVLRGFHYLTLNVARDNYRAYELYLRRGFHVVAPEPGRWSYIDDQGKLREVLEPAWRMEKNLLQS